MRKSQLKKIIREEIQKLNEGNAMIKHIADTIKGENLVDLRKPLESIFQKKEIDFTFSPVAHYRIKYKGKTIIIVNKKYANKAEEIVGSIAIGFEGKI